MERLKWEKEIINQSEYKDWIVQLKKDIRLTQLKASIAVNEEMLILYWNIGKDICQKQLDSKYGSHFFEILSKDLRADFPDAQGFSERNLRYMKQFYTFYSPILHQAGAESKSVNHQVCDDELKIVKFEPEFVSKLNFYCNAVNHLIKEDIDKDTIGLLICSEKNDVVAQWTVEKSNEPIGISTYELTNIIPQAKDILPDTKDIENSLLKNREEN